ncbi:DUF4232 domain-containing protein [Streptomyces daliensis]|uniref:DUF4232 domain-containing protein n=1 Tax=Streptomyces daliensis TaxID=299421 RepID=A0A8T4IU05_9ACTN|nr:DUF4232 domain-containing protein [Streptomyces daliensis]
MTAKLTRAVRCSAAVLAVVAVGAGATACGTASGETSAKAAAHSSTEKGSSSGGQGGQAGGAEGVGSKVKSTAEKGSRTDAVNPSASGKRCHTDELDFHWGGPHGGRPDMDADHQQIVSIQLMNTSSRTCTLHGFPGVRMISESGEAWDLRRSGDEPTTVTLGPGDTSAMLSMTILPVPRDIKDTKPFLPGKVLITPPDETTHVTLEWPYGGAVLDQSGATRPGTFTNPVGIG